MQRGNNASHWINLCPVHNTIGFPHTYPLDSDLSDGWRYPTFQQPRPGVFFTWRYFQLDGLTIFLVDLYFSSDPVVSFSVRFEPCLFHFLFSERSFA